MKGLIVTILIFSFYGNPCFGQQISTPRIERVFLDESNKSINCYTIIYPAQLPSRGYIFLIPGFGETAENVLLQTELPYDLAMNGFLTIIPTFQDGVLSFGVDELSQQSFDRILKDVTLKHNLADQNFYVGGFSIGGSCAIKYAENYKIKPKAIFAIDPPLDFERFYNAAKREVRLSRDNDANSENVYMIDRLERETGGNPSSHMAEYYKLSPYSYSDKSQTAIKKLVTTPLRIYIEPDINWWLQERGADFTNINALECSAMINELKKLGNQNAELIVTQNKGYRKPDNKRHPHSWSIVDNNELINWLIEQ